MRYLGTTLALLITFAPAVFAHDNWCGYDYTQLGVPNNQGNTDDTTLIDLNNRHEIIGGDGFTSYLLDGGLFKDVIRVPGSTTTQRIWKRMSFTEVSSIGSSAMPMSKLSLGRSWLTTSE